VLRYSEGYANNGFNVSLMAYKADWNSTDQIPLRAVQEGQIGRYDAIDNTDGGKAHRYSLSGAWRRTAEDSASKVNAYIIANQLDLWSNFTYFMEDPVHGDQFAQPDKRVTSGLNASHSWHHHTETGNSETTVGVQLQNDNIFNGLYNTQARKTLSVTRQDHIVESSAGLYVENNTRWNTAFRTVVGARVDSYRFDVQSDLAANSGKASDHLVSPSLSLIYGPWQTAEVYANIGSGFHSNDARGTTITIDPKIGLAADKVTPLVRSRGMEPARTAWLPGLQTSLSVYRLDFDSELVHRRRRRTEAGPPSRRYGVEFSNYYKPLKWLSVDLDLAYARARSRGYVEEGSYIPGAIEGTGQLAVTVDDGGPYSASLAALLRPAPAGGRQQRALHASMTLNGRFGWKIRKDLSLELEAFNITNRRDSAIDYYYESQLKGESAAVADIHFHPIESAPCAPRWSRTSSRQRKITSITGVIPCLKLEDQSWEPSANHQQSSLVIKEDGPSLMTVKFGSVTVTAPAPSEAEVERNILEGQKGYARALRRMLRPGIDIPQPPDVPFFHADPDIPGRIIRKLNGVIESGTIVRGKFRPTK
jgi:hypothetical protein